MFCGDLLRHPSEEKITVSWMFHHADDDYLLLHREWLKVSLVAIERFFIEASVKYVTSLMVTFRCEERRKVAYNVLYEHFITVILS